MTKFGEIALNFARIPDITPQIWQYPRTVEEVKDLKFSWSQLDDKSTLLFKRLFLLPDQSILDQLGFKAGNVLAVLGKYLGRRGQEYYDIFRWLSVILLPPEERAEVKNVDEQYASDRNLFDLWQEMNNTFKHTLTPFDFISLYVRLSYDPEAPEAEILTPTGYDDFFRSVAPEQQYPTFTTIEDIWNRNVDSADEMTQQQLFQLKTILKAQADLEPSEDKRNYYPSTFRVVDATYSIQVPPIQSPLALFNAIKLSNDIPFLAYVTGGKIFAKIHKPSSIPLPNSKTLLKKGENVLVLQVQVNGKMIEVSLDLETNILSFESRDVNVDYVLQVLSSFGFTLGTPTKSKFNAIITLEHNNALDVGFRDPIINRRSFLYTMLTSKQFSGLIRLSEQKKSNFFRSEIIMKYQPFSDIVSGLSSDKPQEITLRLKLTQSAAGKVVFQASDVRSDNDARSLQIVLGRLIYIYQVENRLSQEGMFQSLFGQEREIKEEFTSKQLRDAAPEIFNSTFFGLTPKSGYPRILAPEEIEPGKQYTRIMLAGYDLLMTNSNPKYPYFGIKETKVSQGLPYVPWYFKKPQMGGSIVSTFNKVLGTGVSARMGKKAKRTSFESHPIRHGGEGPLAKELVQFLNATVVDGDYLLGGRDNLRTLFQRDDVENISYQIKRRGVLSTVPGHGSSPMLNATYVATLHDPYFEPKASRSSRKWKGISKTYEVLNRWEGDMTSDIVRYRREMLGINDPSVARQELYDYTPEEIIKQIKTTSMPLTSDFIRIYEEMFDINIFVFSIEPVANRAKVKLPRHTHSYINFYNRRSTYVKGEERQCILLYENRNDVDIITLEGAGRVFTKFGSNVGYRIHKVFYQQLFERMLVMADTQLALSKNLEGKTTNQIVIPSWPVGMQAYYMNYNVLWEGESALGVIYQQMIDSKGKRYGVVIADKSSRLITIYHPPQQPLNVRLANGDNPYHSYGLGVGLVPTGVNSKGAWYPLFGLQKGFFVSLTPEAVAQFRNSHPERPYIMEVPSYFPSITRKVGLAKRTQMVQSTSHTLKQIFTWLLDISKDLISYFTTDSRMLDDSQRYDFSKLPVHPPDIKEIKTAIEWLNDNTEGLITSDKKIQVPAALLAKLPVFFSSLKRESVIQFNEPFKSPDDFIQRTNTTILVGTDNYSNWLKTMEESDTYDIPLLSKLPLVGIPNKCVVRFANNTVYYLTGLAPSLSEAIEAIKAWNFKGPNEKQDWILVQSNETYIDIKQKSVSDQPRYFILLSHRDRNLISLMIPLSN